MKVYWISFVNAVLLMVLGAWAYWVSDTPSLTALIPVFAGVLLLALNPGLKKEKKLEAHLAVLLTLLVTIGLFKPLLAAWDRADAPAVARVALMLLSSVVALIAFIQNFRAVRKARKEKG
ncbi:hypothetical protein [Geofilum rhodophaeum]|uniref:hypothetical protein n=1 Tax=Geofilum rhodophaeum TaxID=1965019 RepID=UPI000B524B45|nr:hypothetical protein [Geofilum rhodophaeum]